MSARRRRTPLGTQPPGVQSPESAGSASDDRPSEQSGEIESKDAALEAHKRALEADQEHAVIVQIDDDWLERLELPLD